MNIFLWVLQILLSLHTLMGAVWKFSNSEQAVASLKALPHGVWLAMGVLEFLLAAGLVLPVVSRSAAGLVPLAAACIAGEMLVFSAVHLFSGEAGHGPMIYWLVVAAICAFVSYGRFALSPL